MNDLLKEVFEEDGRGREGRETVGHEDPAAGDGRLVVVLPRLVADVTEELVAQLLVDDGLVDDVVAERRLLLAAQLDVVHEAQHQFEERQRLLEVGVVVLRQQRRLDRLLLGAPQVGLIAFGKSTTVHFKGKPIHHVP